MAHLIIYNQSLWNFNGEDVLLRLFLTSNWVIVAVVIRSVERYDLVKIKLTGLEANHWFHSWLCLLRSSENCIATVTSISRRINQSQCSIPGLAIGWFFLFCFRLQVPKFHWIIRGRAQWNWKNWKCSDSSYSNSVKLTTLLRIPIFDIH